MRVPSVLDQLPRGGELPDEEWVRRHRALTILLWGCVALLGLYAALVG